MAAMIQFNGSYVTQAVWRSPIPARHAVQYRSGDASPPLTARLSPSTPPPSARIRNVHGPVTTSSWSEQLSYSNRTVSVKSAETAKTCVPPVVSLTRGQGPVTYQRVQPKIATEVPTGPCGPAIKNRLDGFSVKAPPEPEAVSSAPLPGEEAGNSGAPNPEEVPLWNSSETSRSPNPFDDGDEQAFESPEPKEICWTPSFTSLKEKSFEENVLEKSFEAKPSRVSLAPTVHEAVSEMDLEGDEGYLGNDVEPEQVQEDGQMTKAMPDVSHASCNDQVSALLREISELRAAAVEEVKTRTELEALQHQTAEQLSSCQTQVAQMAQELKKSKAERDYLKSRLEETSENLVELTKRLRKEQEVNKSLDKELNKAEAARLDLQNQLERFQFQVHEDQPQAMAESLDSSIASAPDLEKEALEEELELPTAGGLLREWANVYEDVTEPRPVLLRRKQWEVPKAGKRIGRAEVSEGTLSMRDLSEIKALKKPPVPVRMLMEVCCLLLHIEPVKCFDESARKRLDYWEPARRYLLSDPFLLSKLRSYKDHIEPAQREKIQKYFKDPDFSSERMLKCSKAAYELYACVSSLAKG
ncbi:Dynein axonemal heavy chain 7 (Axonemal beta dynein heavy chain 7) (Ciliary dynein heavy chain 7) (Dynein heavy chain-like protein 2) (hDHC2) [Durusdinium trenchii]|uniref:Dynein axonemal heavy chain 7 (Axonemal beta dynein heavy chain 7) (Ciliary dynein heavy chain 7) (Dynein heavy chain-like protein 2) (HDHC2) n=1 Tax=Durusdinium trenchii TaxID=1381693 RepID=A0ABP0IA16_9DINO